MARSIDRKIRTCIWLGWFFNLAAAAENYPGPALTTPTSLILGLISVTLFVTGGRYFMLTKGRSPCWAALGLLGIPGFILMLFVKDKRSPRSASVPVDQSPSAT